LFLPIRAKDNNFDALGKTLAEIFDEKAPVMEFVQANAGGVRYLIDLRNFQEHLSSRRTIINNFSVMPDGSLSLPMWYVSGGTPRPIHVEMTAGVEFLVTMAEWMLIHLVMSTLDKKVPFYIHTIPFAEVEQKIPIRYRLRIDASRFLSKIQNPPSSTDAVPDSD
jgi:hypothetical protein